MTYHSHYAVDLYRVMKKKMEEENMGHFPKLLQQPNISAIRKFSTHAVGQEEKTTKLMPHVVKPSSLDYWSASLLHQLALIVKRLC